MRSMAYLLALAKFCMTAVRKAWGKKRPETQKEMGCPLSNQSLKKLMRSFRSLYHAVSGFKERKPTPAQLSGTVFMNSPLPTFSSSSVITTKPLTARLKSGNCTARSAKSRLYLADSCLTTVLRDSSYIVGNLSSNSSRSNCLGVCWMSSAARSSMTSSADLPPPPPPPPPLEEPRFKTSSRSAKDSDSAHVISQFSWSPNTSGGVMMGRPRR
mmetsp:Transcript_99165/g.309310  ORF Transcript_99165/g.309310 Transcript_99165/m.309310 type:complete len:213 (-) Transcript_99165:142-780(-)